MRKFFETTSLESNEPRPPIQGEYGSGNRARCARALKCYFSTIFPKKDEPLARTSLPTTRLENLLFPPSTASGCILFETIFWQRLAVPEWVISLNFCSLSWLIVASYSRRAQHAFALQNRLVPLPPPGVHFVLNKPLHERNFVIQPIWRYIMWGGGDSN